MTKRNQRKRKLKKKERERKRKKQIVEGGETKGARYRIK